MTAQQHHHAHNPYDSKKTNPIEDPEITALKEELQRLRTDVNFLHQLLKQLKGEFQKRR